MFRYLYGDIEDDELGAAHGAEVGSVWFRGPGHLDTIPARQRPADPAAARTVHDIWVSFIHDHVPSHQGTPFIAHRPGATVTNRITGTDVFTGADPFAARAPWWEPEHSLFLRAFGADA